MRRVVLIGVASVIALVASMAGARTLPKGGTFAGIAGGGGAGGLTGTVADNTVVCGTGASTVDSNAALTCTGGALGASSVTIDGSYPQLTLSQASGDLGMVLYNGATPRGGFAWDSVQSLTSIYGPRADGRGSVHMDTDGNVMIAVVAGAPPNPANTLEVDGPAVVGATYAGAGHTAPTNGMLIEGSVCVGATSCTETMSVTGTLSATGNATFNGNVTLGSDTADAVDINADDVEFVNDTVVTLTGGAGGLTFSGGQVVMTGCVSTTAQPVFVYNSVASSLSTIAFANNSGTAQGNVGFVNSGYSDADLANKMVINSASQIILVGRNDDPAAGTYVFQVVDNITGSGVSLFLVDGVGNIFIPAGATRSKGTITLAGGTGTATVASGSVCTCTDTTAANAVQCAVASTTLTATGTGTDVIAYHCI